MHYYDIDIMSHPSTFIIPIFDSLALHLLDNLFIEQ